METNQNDFNSKKTTKLGDYGEQLVDERLQEQGCYRYTPPKEDGRHPLDRMYIDQEHRMFNVEVKTKPKRIYYDDTGINTNHYQEYLHFCDVNPLSDIWLFFVDSDMRKIYCGWISTLSTPRKVQSKLNSNAVIDYPLKQSDITYFPMDALDEFDALTDEEVVKLKELSSRNGNYHP